MVQEHREFLKQLRSSYPAVQRVAEWLRQRGAEVVTPEPREAPTLEDVRQYRDSGDLWATIKGKKYRMEVKNTSHSFPSIIVDQVANYAEKAPSPDFYFLFDSDHTEGTSVLIVDVASTFPDWRVEKRYDRYKQRECEFYFYPQRQLRKEKIP